MEVIDGEEQYSAEAKRNRIDGDAIVFLVAGMLSGYRFGTFDALSGDHVV